MSEYRPWAPGSPPPDSDAEPSSESPDSGREPRESDLESADADPGIEGEGFGTEDPDREPEHAGPGSEDPGSMFRDSGLEAAGEDLGSRVFGLEPEEAVPAFESTDPGLEAPDVEPEDAGAESRAPDVEPEAPDPETQESRSASPAKGGGVWARLRKLDTRAPRPKAQDPGPGTQDPGPRPLARLAGFERRRVPEHVFMIESGRLLYGRFLGEAAPLNLSEFHERPLPAGLWPDGPLGGPARDPAALAEAVKELVGAAATRPAEASLVVPDAWLRLAFTELNELPRAGEERDAVLRWKLKGLTPFRVDELRVEAAPMKLPGEVKATAETGTDAGTDADDEAEGEATHRVLIGFGVDRLLSQLEEVFAGAGVRVGQLVSSGLALASLAGALDREGSLTALVYVRPEGYGLAFQHRNALLFHRVKLRGGDTDVLGQVHRDLMLTRSYLDEHFPALELSALMLLAPESERFRWLQWLGDGFERQPVALAPEDLPVTVNAVPADWLDAAPMLGAALGEY